MGCRLSRDRSVVPDGGPRPSFVKAMSFRRPSPKPQPLNPMVPSVRTRPSVLVSSFSGVDDQDELSQAVHVTPE